jgi:hypothetical protein
MIGTPQRTRRTLADLRRIVVTHVYDLAAWIPRVPEIEAKLVLGDRLYDLVWVASALRDRELELLGEPDDAPLPQASISRASTTRSRLVSLCTALDQLADQFVQAYTSLDPILDARSCEALRETARRLRDGIAHTTSAAIPEIAGVDPLDPLDTGVDWRMPRLPARDDRFTVVATVPHPQNTDDPTTVLAKRFHFLLMSTEVPTIEHCARLIVIARGLRPWDFVRDMGRQIFDEVRHAQACILEVRRAGAKVGSFPVELNLWVATRDASVDLSLTIHQQIGERIGVDAAAWGCSDAGCGALGPRITAVFNFILCDEVAHVRYGNRWVEGDRDELRRQAQRERARAGLTGGGLQPYAANLDLYRQAGFTEQEAQALIEGNQ